MGLFHQCGMNAQTVTHWHLMCVAFLETDEIKKNVTFSALLRHSCDAALGKTKFLSDLWNTQKVHYSSCEVKKISEGYYSVTNIKPA